MVRYTATELVVTTPNYSGTGWVSIDVANDAGSNFTGKAHQYWEDGTGTYGTTGAIEWYTMVGGYWSSPSDFGAATIVFTAPTTTSYYELAYANALDTCELNYASTASFSALLPNTTSLSLNKPATGSISLLQDTTYNYIYAEDLGSGDFIENATYSLSPITTDPDFPSFSMKGIVETPASFKVSSPAIHGTSPPNVSQSTSLSWGGSGGDYMLAYFLRYEGSAIIDEVSCVMKDDGSFTVPSTVWSDWSKGDQVSVLIGRALEPSTTLPYNNADNGVVGILWMYGAGFQN